MPVALEYLKYLSTNRYSAEEINKEFYKYASSFNISSDSRSTSVQLNGLNSNLAKSIELLEHLLTDCQPDQNKLEDFINDYIRNRENSWLSLFGEIITGILFDKACWISFLKSKKTGFTGSVFMSVSCLTKSDCAFLLTSTS